MNREEKARVIEELTERLRGGSVVVVDYQGMNVAQSTRLRARSRESGVEFVVAKNTLAQRAANEAGVEGLEEFLVGPTAIAFTEDPVEGAKLMSEFSNEAETFEIKGGILDGGQVMSAEDDTPHLVSFPLYESGLLSNESRYVASCGRTVLAAAMGTAPGRPCPLCRAALHGRA